MNAWVLTDKKKMELQQRSVPAMRDREVLIKIKAMGICGSDLHFYEEGKIGPYVTNGNPLILGHECSGDVVAVGENCETLSVGDRVVVEPGIPCMNCDECRGGRYNFCHHMYFMGTPPADGCMCEYVAWPEFLTYKMPDEMTYQEGAMIEPFVVGLQAVRNSGIGFGDSAVVVGCGTIGLMTIHALKSVGVGRIVGLSRQPFKLEMALKMGATDAINALDGNSLQKVRELTDGYGAMYGFEAAGAEETFYDIADYVRDGATITLLGLLIEDGTPMPMSSAVMRGLNYHTVIRYTNMFQRAMTMLKYKRSDILPVLTHQFDFLDAQAAFDQAICGDKRSIKVMLNF